MKIQMLDHIAIISGNVQKSLSWYEDVLGLKKIYEGQWDGVPSFIVAKGTGTGIAIFPAKTNEPNPKPQGDYLIVDHFAFRVSGEDFALAQEELKEKGVDFRIADHDVAKSLYMKDPDGYTVELTTYEV